LLTQQEPIVWAFGGGFLALGAILYAVARLTKRR
jgi:APA family basic amino acid/polyamine antiporter